jgi:hypothetical protein
MKCFGFSIESVRAFNPFLASVTGLLVYLAVTRLRLINRSVLRVTLVALIMCSSAFSNVYLNNRYDMPGVLLLAVMFVALTTVRSVPRRTILFVCSVLLPLTGSQFIPYTGSLVLILLFVCGWAVGKDVIAVVLGSAVGVASMVFVLTTHGALGSFLHTVAANCGPEPVGWEPGMLWRAIILDPSTVIVGIGVVVGLLRQLATDRTISMRSAVDVGIIAAVVIPIIMTISGRYTTMYTWMVFMPLSVCFVMDLDHNTWSSRWLRCSGIVLLAFASLVGMPAQLAFAATEWSERDYRGVEEFVTQTVEADDVVYCACVPYYPIKKLVKGVYVSSYLIRMTHEEKQQVTCIVADRQEGVSVNDLGDVKKVERAFGGQWRMTGQYQVRRSVLRQRLWPRPKETLFYDLVGFRRIRVPRTSQLPEREVSD